ncbi:MAG: hypothetical protein P8J32_04890 [bacterium]|nr:hypothetical protein [bacterium]
MEDQFDQFKTHFKPKLNHLAQENNPSPDPESCAPLNGLMYETYGEEFAHVQEQDPNCVWTVIVTDDTEYDNFMAEFKCNDCQQDDEDEQCTCGDAQAAADKEGLEPVWYICKGFHHVNRHGYIITEVPWNDETEDVEY